jgi:VCBS repeat protein
MSFRSFAALLFVTLISFELVAQTGQAPTVNIRRNNSVNFSVVAGDFNGDGIVDLAGQDPWVNGPPAALVVLGKGDGTFGAPIRISCVCRVLAVGDFNGDGKADLLVTEVPEPDVTIVVLLGNGDGTFAPSSTANMVTQASSVSFGLAADVDGDGNLDVVLGMNNEGSDIIDVVAGNGDGTFRFETSTVFAAGKGPLGGAVGDLDGDGRKDIVVANHEGHSLSILLNQGGTFTFSADELALDRSANDVAIADVNRDGNPDLVVAMSDAATFNFTVGYAYVLFGGGTGRFAPPVAYPTAPGAWRIVLGDLTRDGILDIATANRSALYSQDCGPLLKDWDSVSILPGKLDGTFGAASSFSLGKQNNMTDVRFRNSVQSLTVADVNGDHQPDLVASWGAILLNQPADPNWAPTVNLGPDRAASPDHSVLLEARADDVDQDRLTYSWTDSRGEFIASVPNPCFVSTTLGVHTITVTVNDGHGHTASDSIVVDFGGGSYTPPTISIAAPTAGAIVAAGVPYTLRWTVTPGSTAISEINVYKWFETDPPALIAECSHLPASATSCQWNDPNPLSETAHVAVSVIDSVTTNSVTSDRFSIRGAPGGGSLPAGWSHTDVGAVAAAGDASFTNGVFTVRGSGADIWGTADEFHFAYQQLTTQFEIVTRADSVQNVHAWTKAGLMVRTSLDPSAAQASIFVTPGKGVSFQRRLNQSAASVSTTVAGITAPVWLRLTGFNGRIWAYYKKNLTDRWTLVGSDVLSNYTAAFVGLAVTSHADGTVATATFSQLRSGAIPDWGFGGGIGCGPCGASYDGTVFGLFARSSDIWGVADSFEYIATPIEGDATITVRVDQVDNTHAWAKAGIMFRETKETGARNVLAMATPGNGVNLQYRSVTNGQSVRAASIAGTAPGWLRLRRAGHTFTASWSTDGVTFVPIGSITVTMNSGILVGMAFTSHNTSVSGGSLFEEPYIIQ